MKLRKTGEPDRRWKDAPGYCASELRIKKTHRHWDHLKPDPEHVAILRSGIKEFRAMLDAVDRERQPSRLAAALEQK